MNILSHHAALHFISTPSERDGKVDADAHIEFLNQFNEFINHEPKPFRKIIDRVMKL